jgi:hypothetical protein
MTKIASALGGKYQENRLSVMTRTFVLGDHTFKVRVPAVHEIETIFNYFKNPDEALVEKAFKELTYELINIKDTNPKGVVYSENDVVVESRSMREAAKNKVILQYSDIEEEFPLSIQIQLVDKISEVISPDYKAIKEK